MHIHTLLRGLFTSIVALTLGHTARAQGTNCGTHYGYLLLTEVTSQGQNVYGYVKAAATGYDFGVDPTYYHPAEFSFTGCQAGSAVALFCISCDPSGKAVAAITNTLPGTSPSNWMFYNAGVNPSWYQPVVAPALVGDLFIYSQWFTWGGDDLIRPVTFDNNGVNQEILYNAYYSSPYDELTFIQGDDNGVHYYLKWVDVSQYVAPFNMKTP